MNGHLTTLLLAIVNALLGAVIFLLNKAYSHHEEEIKMLRSKVHLLQVDVRELQTKESIWDRKERRK